MVWIAYTDIGWYPNNSVIERLWCIKLTLKAPITTITDFANTVDPDETAHNEPSHLHLQCLPTSL